MRIGLFGGTFDPPHIGHLILAAEAHHQLQLDKLLWVLTATPPHKPGRQISPVEQRLELVQAAIDNNPAFTLSRVDIDRPPPHYSTDSVALVHHQYPGAALFFVMGGDSLRDMATWHDPQLLVDSVDGFGVMRRPGAAPDLEYTRRQLPGLIEKITWIDVPQIDISSTLVRQAVAMGRPYRYYLTPAVFEMIERNHYYGFAA
jgi:nicotinate-nucleotide adenylyltransferase